MGILDGALHMSRTRHRPQGPVLTLPARAPSPGTRSPGADCGWVTVPGPCSASRGTQRGSWESGSHDLFSPLLGKNRPTSFPSVTWGADISGFEIVRTKNLQSQGSSSVQSEGMGSSGPVWSWRPVFRSRRGGPAALALRPRLWARTRPGRLLGQQVMVMGGLVTKASWGQPWE